MAETIGLAASVVALAQLACDSCKKLNDTIQGFRNAPEKLKNLRDDLHTLQQLIASLRTSFELVGDAPIPPGRREVFEGLKPVMQGCQKLCDEFTKRLSELTSHSDADRISKRDRVQLHFNDTDIMLLKERLLQYKLTFDLALGVASLNTASQSNEMVEALETKVVTSLNNLTGKIESLQVVTQALSTSLQVESVEWYNSTETNNLRSVVATLGHYELVLKQCLEVHAPALEETSKLNGTTVKWISSLNDAKQFAGNIGDVGKGGPPVLIERAEARDQARNYFGNISGDVVLELMKKSGSAEDKATAG